MKIKIFFVLTILLSSFAGLANEVLSKEEVKKAVNHFLFSKKEITKTMKYTSESWGFGISCPIGVVCDENYVYRAFETTGDKDDTFAKVYLSFNPSIVNQIEEFDIDELKNEFNYANLTIYFNHFINLKGWHLRHNSLLFRKDLLEQNVFFYTLRPSNSHFTKGAYLVGEIKVKLSDLYAFKESDKDCYMSGRMPEKCIVRFDKSLLNFNLKFDLFLPDGVLKI